MATWNDLVAHIQRNYKADVRDGFISLGFKLKNDRTQLVFIMRTGNENIGVWARVMSPIAEYSVKALESASKEAADMVCGGIVLFENMINLADSIPLENLDVNEIEAPLALITTSADALEKRITGKDDY